MSEFEVVQSMSSVYTASRYVSLLRSRRKLAWSIELWIYFKQVMTTLQRSVYQRFPESLVPWMALVDWIQYGTLSRGI